ncbi:CGNR zinc finger domain-containing protein [Streptomyces sp. NPDC088387]|uniref:CGNR zinc finger domain-containing protein n=1 Tax=Streptomyces sp. NPDC088387 TaxID=3365859 RepID=UPI00380252CE
MASGDGGSKVLAAGDPRMAFPFLGGRLCLNFVGTLGMRYTDRLDRLPDGPALARWVAEAGLGDGVDGTALTPRDLHRARELREAVYRLVDHARRGLPVDHADVVHVNEAAAHQPPTPQLAAREGGLSVRWAADDVVPAVLASVARDAVALVGGPLLGKVKECERAECSLLFLDESQAGRRRWCSMQRCGNLAKIAGYRSRRQG